MIQEVKYIIEITTEADTRLSKQELIDSFKLENFQTNPIRILEVQEEAEIYGNI